VLDKHSLAKLVQAPFASLLHENVHFKKSIKLTCALGCLLYPLGDLKHRPRDAQNPLESERTYTTEN
jgi:hypothetical protein